MRRDWKCESSGLEMARELEIRRCIMGDMEKWRQMTGGAEIGIWTRRGMREGCRGEILHEEEEIVSISSVHKPD